MTIQAIICFLTVAETLNYTKTAEKLYISQPAVSRHIISLEEELNTSLIDRSCRRSIELTPAGKLLYQSLKRCRDDFLQTKKDIQALSDSIPVTINIPQGIMIPQNILNKIDDFRKKYPELSVSLNYINATQTADALKKGEAVFICQELLGEIGKYDILPCHEGLTNYYLLFSESNQILKEHTAPSPEYFKEFPLFLPETLPAPILKKLTGIYCDKIGGKKEYIRYCNSIEAVIMILKTNACITIGNGWSSMIERPGYRKLELEQHTQYYIAWDRKKASVLMTQLFESFQ